MFPRSYLNDPHVEAGLLRELFPDVSRGLGRGRERRLERLELFGFDGGARASALRPRALLVVLVTARVFIREVARLRVFPIVLWVLRFRRQARLTTRRY